METNVKMSVQLSRYLSGGWEEGRPGLMFDESGLAAPLIDQSEDANRPAFFQGVG